MWWVHSCSCLLDINRNFRFDLENGTIVHPSRPFGSDFGQLTGVFSTGFTDLGINQYGFDLQEIDFSFSDVNAGVGWITLSNATSAFGNPVYWDENSGPSQAFESTLGSIPSEAFSLDGGDSGCVQDAPQDGFKIIHNFTDSEPGGGLAIDPAGKLYGTTGSGGNNGLGLAYKLALSGQDWIFTPLYSFLGGAGGQSPLPEIIGPERALYGTADGGIRSCGSAGKWLLRRGLQAETVAGCLSNCPVQLDRERDLPVHWRP